MLRNLELFLGEKIHKNKIVEQSKSEMKIELFVILLANGLHQNRRNFSKRHFLFL